MNKFFLVVGFILVSFFIFGCVDNPDTPNLPFTLSQYINRVYESDGVTKATYTKFLNGDYNGQCIGRVDVNNLKLYDCNVSGAISLDTNGVTAGWQSSDGNFLIDVNALKLRTRSNLVCNDVNCYSLNDLNAIGSGGGTPAGDTNQIQFNNNGAFGADANFVWDSTNDRLGIGTSQPQYKSHLQYTEDISKKITDSITMGYSYINDSGRDGNVLGIKYQYVNYNKYLSDNTLAYNGTSSLLAGYGLYNDIVADNGTTNSTAVIARSNRLYGVANVLTNSSSFTDAKTYNVDSYGVYNEVNDRVNETNAGGTITSTNYGSYNYVFLRGVKSNGTLNTTAYGNFNLISETTDAQSTSTIGYGDYISITSSRSSTPLIGNGVWVDRVDGNIRRGIVLDQDGVGGDILFGETQDANIGYSLGGLLLNPNETNVNNRVVIDTWGLPNTLVQGDILYAGSARDLNRLAKDATATRYLSNTGTSNNPAWAQVNLTNGVTGTLPTANGGTNQTSWTAGRVVFPTSATQLGGDGNFFWDNTNKRLGLGTSSPTNLLDVTQGTTTANLTPVSFTTNPAGTGITATSTIRGILNTVNDSTSTANTLTRTHTSKGISNIQNLTRTMAGSGINNDSFYGIENTITATNTITNNNTSSSYTTYGIFSSMSTNNSFNNSTTNSNVVIGNYNEISLADANLTPTTTINSSIYGSYIGVQESNGNKSSSGTIIGQLISLTGDRTNSPMNFVGLKITTPTGTNTKGIILSNNGTGGGIYYGTNNNAYSYFDGNNFVLNPDVNVLGYFKILGNTWIPDSNYLYFGATRQHSIRSDGIDLVINPREVGGGILNVTGPLSATDASGNASISTASRYLTDSSGGTTALDWDSRTMYNIGGNMVIDWDNSQLINPTGAIASLDWDARTTFDSAGVQSIYWGNRTLHQSGTAKVLDWENSTLNYSGTEGIMLDWFNGLTNDTSARQSINWETRYLYDTGGNVNVDWENKVLQDAGTTNLDWTNKVLQSTGITTLDWNNKLLYSDDGSSAIMSLDWYNRDLNGDWNALGNFIIEEDLTVLGNINVDGNMSIKRPYATFSSTETQTIAVASTAYLMDFNWTDDSYLITKESDTNFRVQQTGVYRVLLSAISTVDLPNKHVEVWFRKNGVNIPRSNTKMEVASTSAEIPLVVEINIDLNTTDVLNVMWASDDAGTQIVATGATGYSPASPSVIMVLNKISEIKTM